MFEIGNSLREARLRQGLDFAEVEQATKIRGKYLRALEDEHFEQLPGQTYVKGFLRTYADYLGLEGQLYVDEYNSRYVTGGDDDLPLGVRGGSTWPRSGRLLSSAVLIALTAIGLSTALVIAAWKFGATEDRTPVLDGARQTQKPRAEPAVKRRRQAQTPARGRLRIVLVADRGDSWVRVYRNSPVGALIFDGTIERGKRQVFDERRIWVEAGNPAALVLRVNGKRRRVPVAERAFRVSRHGVGI